MILGPTSRFFIANQIVKAYDHHRLVTIGRCYSMLPSFRKFNAINNGDDVDAVGWETHLENNAWRGKVLKRQVEKGCPEFIEGLPYLLRILWTCFDPDIQVFGEARRTVNRQSITPDNKEFSLRGVQCGKQISEVWVHTHWVESK